MSVAENATFLHILATFFHLKEAQREIFLLWNKLLSGLYKF
jgi:hypothetical protein